MPKKTKLQPFRSWAASLLFYLGFAAAAVAADAPSNHWPSCRDEKNLAADLKALRRDHASFFRLDALAKSKEGREVWLAELGRGDEKDRRLRPALLVVAGVEGNDLAGTEMAMAFLNRLCEKEKESKEIQSLLESVVVYVIPRLNPDAAERYFMKPRMEMAGDAAPFDADHDGLVDEDVPDDLDGDGMISWLRVEDPKGTLIPHPGDERLLIEADPAKNERGRFLLFLEGKDNDADKKINEDPLGEVNFNRNFPFHYPWFAPDAGVYQICENETRALAEFILGHPNIAAVFTYASNDNLLKTPPSADRSFGRDPQEKIRTEDSKYYEKLGELYREQLGIEKTIDSPSVSGAFSDWIYFHRGILSLCASAWSPDLALALKKEEPEKKEEKKEEANGEKPKDQEKKEEKKEEKKKEKEDERGKTELEYLKWLDENAPDYFIPWKSVKHPDYPNQKAEIGGFAPYAKTLPPAEFLPQLAEKHAEFLMQLLKKLPRIRIQDIEIKALEQNVFEIEVKVENAGFLPTILAHGERTGEIFPTRLETNLPAGAFLAGSPRARVGALHGSGGIEEIRYIVKAPAGTKVEFTLISAQAGRDARTVVLTGGGK
ncbi:MAG: M14 family metallopeptidase [Candidatus Omnitrophota bacterium]